MAESLFNIFGDHTTSQAVKNVTRQPLSSVGNENLGKSIKNVSTGLIKRNEPVKNNQPMKKKFGENKKSFLSNTGKALQSTPVRQVFTPRAVNVGSMIYSDGQAIGTKGFDFEALEFTKPSFKYDNFHTDMFDFFQPEPAVINDNSPPNTPPSNMRRQSMEFIDSYQDEFFMDDFSNQSLPDDDDLGLPSIY